MNRNEAQVFVNEVERRIMEAVKDRDIDQEKLENALNEFDQSMMKLMALISEDI